MNDWIESNNPSAARVRRSAMQRCEMSPLFIVGLLLVFTSKCMSYLRYQVPDVRSSIARRIGKVHASESSQEVVAISEKDVEVKQWLVGTFSNQRQAANDARRGRPTAREGGHEHVTANITLHPSLSNVLIASYYYGTNRTSTFRFRCYEFYWDISLCSQRMRIYRPTALADASLKAINYDRDVYFEDLLSQGIDSNVTSKIKGGGRSRERERATEQLDGTEHMRIKELNGEGMEQQSQIDEVPLERNPQSLLTCEHLVQQGFELLEGCDVQWTRMRCFPFNLWVPLWPWSSPRYRGSLVEGSCKVCSQSDPTLQLVVKDDLQLSKNSLSINDRVYTAAGQQIIGSRDGVPYKLRRI